jgi:hypothetical protein
VVWAASCKYGTSKEKQMSDLLKNMLNHDSLREFALTIQSSYNQFQVNEFLTSIMDETWDGLELMARGRKVSTTLGEYLPKDYTAKMNTPIG